MKRIYAALAVPGFLLPLSQLLRPGFDLAPLWRAPIASMFSLDLIVSCIAFWAFVYATNRVKHRWIYVAMTLLVGLSFALPMFLWARERAS